MFREPDMPITLEGLNERLCDIETNFMTDEEIIKREIDDLSKSVFITMDDKCDEVDKLAEEQRNKADEKMHELYEKADQKIKELSALATMITLHDSPTSPISIVALHTVDGINDSVERALDGLIELKVKHRMTESSVQHIGEVQAGMMDRHEQYARDRGQLRETLLSLRHDVDVLTRRGAGSSDGRARSRSPPRDALMQQLEALRQEHRETKGYLHRLLHHLDIQLEDINPLRPRLPLLPGETPYQQMQAMRMQEEGTPRQELGLRGGTQIFIKTLTGKTITIDDIDGTRNICELKQVIRLKLHLIFTQNADFYMIFGGHRLADHRTLDSYNIISGSTVWMVMRLRGGMDAGPPCNKPKSKPELIRPSFDSL